MIWRKETKKEQYLTPNAQETDNHDPVKLFKPIWGTWKYMLIKLTCFHENEMKPCFDVESMIVTPRLNNACLGRFKIMLQSELCLL